MSNLATRLLYLSYQDVQALDLPMGMVLGALASAFREKAQGHSEVPPKGGIHPAPDAFIHAMPACLPGAAGVKWVGAYPGNRRRGFPNISGLIILNDPETGIPIAVMDARWITTQRTAAATALSARFLARPDSETVGMLGCGLQARTHVRALREVFGLKRIHAYDTHLDRAAAFATEVRERFTLEVIAVPEPRAAVANLDIVVTMGAISLKPHATIEAGWLAEGAFASAVDFDAYWSPAALSQFDKFCTDDTAQLERFQQMGYFQHVPRVHADLAELVSGQKPGRQSAQERTMACNLGLALEDVVTAALVYRRALEGGLGTWLPL